jgi:hypothetical protein
MTAPSMHGDHVSRHLAHLARAHDALEIRALLECATLRRSGAELISIEGSDIGPAECTRYLEAVRQVMGDAEYYPARVNFILARCACLAQPSGADIPRGTHN